MPSKKCPCGFDKRHCAVCDPFSWWPPHLTKPEPGSADARRLNDERARWVRGHGIPEEEQRRLDQAWAEAKAERLMAKQARTDAKETAKADRLMAKQARTEAKENAKAAAKEAKEKARAYRLSEAGVRAAKQRKASSTYRSAIKRGRILNPKLETVKTHRAGREVVEAGANII